MMHMTQVTQLNFVRLVKILPSRREAPLPAQFIQNESVRMAFIHIEESKIQIVIPKMNSPTLYF